MLEPPASHVVATVHQINHNHGSVPTPALKDATFCRKVFRELHVTPTSSGRVSARGPFIFCRQGAPSTDLFEGSTES